MIFENPRIPEGINSGRRRPLRDLAVLGGGVGALLGLTVVLFLVLAQLLGPSVPFSWERALAGSDDPHRVPEGRQKVALAALGQRVAAAMDLPDGMEIEFHLLDLDTVNAFATLGGHVFVTTAMIGALPNENALAWVLAHEIAHVRHRDHMRGASTGMLLGLLGAVVAGDSGIGDLVVGSGGMVGALHFSRQREEAADAAGLPALLSLYGHVGGYRDALDALRPMAEAEGEPPVMLASHPHLDVREERLEALVAAQGWPVLPDRVPLAAELGM